MAWWKKDQLDHINTAEWQELQTPEDTLTNITTWDKPDALKTSEELKSSGEWVWAPSQEYGYVPARIISSENNQIYLVGQNNEQIYVKNGTYLENLSLSSLQRITHDLVLLDDMNNPLILHNLRKRFEKDEIYTNVGTILISINPYKSIPLYTSSVISSYRNKGIGKEMPPHVYNIAADALFGILDGNGKGQSIIISGESGAGKTEATKQCLSYVAAVAGSVGGVEQKILQSNPILEAFGNAKTIRNDNSSRFGKYIEIFLENTGKLCSSKTTNFLLEKVRVIHQAPNERNFHVFYQLCKAVSDTERQKYQLKAPQNYRYLSQSGCFEVPTIDDANDYAELLEAMELLGFTDFERDSIFSIVAAILHLGNIEFVSSGDKQCKVKDMTPLNNAARLLQVTPEILNRGVTIRQFRIIGQANTDVTLSVKEAEDSRDALSKFVYAAVFDWLVIKINKSMDAAVANVSTSSSAAGGFGVKSLASSQFSSSVNNFNPNKCIGILDIFGFEIFEHNSFEQLCINFCNEKLQHHFSDHTFKLEEIVYAQEGIKFDKIKYIDNGPVLELIEARPQGILRILDEEIIIPKGSDATFLQKSLSVHSKNPNFKNVMKIANSFAIMHYAGQVIYDSIGFLEKNKDTLSEDNYELLGSTQLKFMFEIFPNLGQKLSSKERKASLGFQFSKQLDALMGTLNATEPHYIRCVKPNNDKRKDHFIAANVMEQLRYSGVFEAVAIRRCGFPFRQTHNNFVERYKLCNLDKKYPVSKEGCQQLIADMKLNVNNVQMGKTMILYRSEEYKILELHRSINLERSTIVEKLNSLISRNPETEKDPEFYFQELSRTVKRAKELHFTNDAFDKARELLFNYIENRIDLKVKLELEKARAIRDLSSLDHNLAICDANEFDTSLVRKARGMRDRMNRIVAEAISALPAIEERPMGILIKAADELEFKNDYIEYFRALLFQTPKDVYLKEQMKAAVKLGDNSRAIRLTLKLKDIVLSNSEDQFQFYRYGKLKTAKDWVEETWVSFDPDKLAAGMLSYSEDSTIHASLIDFLNIGVSKEHAEKLDKNAQSVYKRIVLFSGVNQKSTEQKYKYAQEVISYCLQEHHIIDEAYLVVMKQLTKNPNSQIINDLWEMMAILLCTFPPNADFENYVEVFLRQKSSPREKYLGALHKIVYEGTKYTASNLPSINEIQQAGGNLATRARGFSEPLPPAAPSYFDLMTPYQDIDPEAEYFAKKAPKVYNAQIHKQEQFQTIKPQSIQKVYSVPKKQLVWESAVDPNSGETYYYNSETGESTWDMPAELKFKHIRVGSRV